MTTEIILTPELQPTALFAPTPKAARRAVEFFTAQVSNDHTRKAYLNAARRFSEWCAGQEIEHLSSVQPFHVAAFVKQLQGEFAPPTVKQHLAALRMLFDWLVTGHVLDVNPAHAVRGPKYVVKKGKTPVLNADEARAILDAIDTSSLIGLRDRALIGIMVYTFARINAVLEMKVADYFIQGRCGWVRLHEKGGKEHEVPCHHKLEKYLDEYIAAAGIADDAHGLLFRTSGRKTGQVATGRLPHDPAPRRRRRHQDPHRQPHLPRHRHHRLSQERRNARTCADHRQSLLTAHHQALRQKER